VACWPVGTTLSLGERGGEVGRKVVGPVSDPLLVRECVEKGENS
jgi:hypothetical protein